MFLDTFFRLPKILIVLSWRKLKCRNDLSNAQSYIWINVHKLRFITKRYFVVCSSNISGVKVTDSRRKYFNKYGGFHGITGLTWWWIVFYVASLNAAFHIQLCVWKRATFLRLGGKIYKARGAWQIAGFHSGVASSDLHMRSYTRVYLLLPQSGLACCCVW